MQFFGNVASAHGRMVSKSAQEGYYEFRLFESQRGADADPCLYTVRMMLDENPQLNTGVLAMVTERFKTDFYLSRELKPNETLLIIAFEASKIFKLAALPDVEEPVAAKETVKEKAPTVQRVRLWTSALAEPPMPASERHRIAVAQEESDWSTPYS